MSEMVERVGLVIMKADGCGMTNDAGKRVFCNDSSIPDGIRGEGPCECQQTARAAIEAMRSPTEEMKKTGAFTTLETSYADEDSFEYISEEVASEVWKRMIDAALQTGDRQ